MDIFPRLRTIIAERLGIEETEIKEESDFIEDLGADSLDVVEMIMAIEEEFDIEVPDEDAEKIKTVKDAVNYIQKKISS